MISETTKMLSSPTSVAADSQAMKTEHSDGTGNIKMRRKLDVHYFGFRIGDPDALESMNILFEKIKKAIWPDQDRYPLIRRSKFNTGFKNINLWAANFGQSDAQRFESAFEKFTDDLAGTLNSVRIVFGDIDCGFHKGRISVRLIPDSESQRVLRRLQGELILRFSEFQKPGYVKLYNPKCRLLSLNTEMAFANVANVVRECFDELGCSEARLEPFIVCQDHDVLYQYPKSASANFETNNNVPEWVARSLCVSNISPDYEKDPWKIIASLAVLIGFELEDDMIETCDPKNDYYTPGNTGRTVAVFRTVSLRDSFYMSTRSYLNNHAWRIDASNVIAGCPRHSVYVLKALPAMEDQLLHVSREACSRYLREYRASIDVITLAHYLEQRHVPLWQYYFKTEEELHDLMSLLKNGVGTEYLSSVW